MPILSFQDYQFQQSMPEGIWRWTTRMDLSGLTPSFSIRDIFSPYGLLRDSIPLPGPIIQAMAGSITNLQSAFAPVILAAPAALVFTLDEGRGVGQPLSLTVTNAGGFGSLLDVTLTTSASYIVVRPFEVGGIPSQASGAVDVLVDSTNLVATASPYAGTVVLQDSRATNTPITVPVTINVRPKATIATDLAALTFYVVKPLDGPFPPIPVQTFTLSNTGLPASSLDFVVQKLINNSPWLVSYSPASGTLLGGGSQAITVGVSPAQACLRGTYTETLRVSGYSSNGYTDVQVTLVIT